MYEELKNNTANYFVYYKNNKRCIKTFKEFRNDVDNCVARLNYLKKNRKIENVAIMGVPSYMWVVIDHACIKGGYRSVAVPETFSDDNIKQVLNDFRIDLFLCDFSIKRQILSDLPGLYHFNCTPSCLDDIEKVSIDKEDMNDEENLILKDYSIVFSSGTSEKIKYITIEYKEEKPKKKKIFGLIEGYFNYRQSIFSNLSRKNNKIIIYLPLSHQMQRMFIEVALLYKFNIIISDPKNCFKHIIQEKPNIMVSVPPIYEAMSIAIRSKLERIKGLKHILFVVFNKLKINNFSNKNIIKQLFQKVLFSKIMKIYGGRADCFVVGSAPSDPETTKTFYSIGVKICEAYGLSELNHVISMNTPRQFKIGSVGKPTKDVEIKISDESEVLVKYDEEFDGQNKNILEIDDEDFIHTKDIGYLDKDGFLFITGRKDYVIILDSGKKVHPAKLETLIKRNDIINYALIFSLDNAKINLIVNPINSITIDQIRVFIQQVNKSLLKHEKIFSFNIVKEPFTIENGMLTSTLKMKRKTIINTYGTLDNHLVSLV
jgi:long-chain acyl-CoA synthetase